MQPLSVIPTISAPTGANRQSGATWWADAPDEVYSPALFCLHLFFARLALVEPPIDRPLLRPRAQHEEVTP